MRAILLSMLLLTGCNWHTGQTAPAQQISDSTAAVAEPLARAGVRREIAAKDVEQTDRKVAKDQLQAMKADLADARDALTDARDTAHAAVVAVEARRADEQRQREDAERDLQHLQTRWYVVAGRWIERIIWIAAAVYAGLGISGVALCIWGGPTGLLIGREILGLLPVANIFTNAARWLGGRRG